MNKKYVTYVVIISLLLVCIGTAYAGRSFEQEKLRQESELQKINEAYNGRDSFFDVEYDGYFSHLLVFPENNMESMNVELLYCFLSFQMSISPIPLPPFPSYVVCGFNPKS